MVVTINAVPSAGSPLPNPASFVLSAGGKESPNGFSIQTGRNVQMRQFLRGPKAKQADRGNLHTTVAFSVTRYFDNIADAEQYILLHAATIPGGGTVKFTSTSGTNFYMTDSVVSTTESKQTGRTTLHSYSIVGGVISLNNIS